MAQIGLRHFKWSPMDEDGKYTGVKEMAGAITATPSLNIAEANLYADDTLVESAKEFTNGTLALTVADDDDAVFAPLLGHTKTTDGEVFKGVEDIPPYVGFGRVIVKMVNGVKKYKAEFFPKVQFKPFATEGQTKGESIEFRTPTVEGTIYGVKVTVEQDTKVIYERHKTFDTDAEAQAYLNDLMKVPTEQTSSGSSGTEQTSNVTQQASVQSAKTSSSQSSNAS